MDPSFSAQLLRVANSVLFGARGEVADLSQAIALLGLERVKSMAIFVALDNLVRSSADIPALRKIWVHSLVTAYIAEEAARAAGIACELAYTTGLLQNLGTLGLMSAYPDEYTRMLEDSDDIGFDLLMTERESGTLLFPAVVNGANVAQNPKTGAVYGYARSASFDPTTYSTSPYSGMVQYQKQAYKNPGLVAGPRVGFAWDVFGTGKFALRGGFGIFFDRAMSVGWESASGVGVGPLMAPPAFQAPTYYNTNFNRLLSAQGFLTPQSVFSGTEYKTPATYTWSLGIQRSLGKGLILDVAYVGNTVHNRFGQVDINGVAPLTDWTPTGGANPKYLDPTTGGKAFYTANLMRPYVGYGAINATCSCLNFNYNSLQTQVNRRFGKRLQFGANWTWAKTMGYSRSPWTPDRLAYAEVTSDRPQVVNANYSYDVPKGSRLWSNSVTRMALDGWRFNGIAKIMSGTPLTVGCGSTGAPIGYWTGTPTGGIPFRCDMADPSPFVAAGTTIPSNVQPRLYYPLNAANFRLPSANSLGIGNTPPTMFLGPGFRNFDFSLLKDFRMTKEGRVTMQFKAEAFNVLNHFNPGNPNTSLTLTYAGGVNTNANFGTITGVVGQARHVALSLKLRF